MTSCSTVNIFVFVEKGLMAVQDIFHQGFWSDLLTD